MSDGFTKDERAAEAKSLQGNKLLNHVLEQMERDAIVELKGIPVGDLTAAAPHGTLVAIEKFKAYLQSIVNDDKLYKHQHRAK